MAPGGEASDRLTTSLFRELPVAATAWLPRQRWFSGKSNSIDRVEVEDVLWCGVRPTETAIVVLDVRYAPGAYGAPSHERYAILVGIYDDPRGCPAISPLPLETGRHIVEAAADGRAIGDLLYGLIAGDSVRGVRGGELGYADATARVAQILAPQPSGFPPVASVGVEQSNSSVRIGSSHVLKLFRRLEHGVNPQIEIGRFLARTGFRAAPPLEGSLTYRSREGDECALGALEGWVANSGDGWSYVVASLRRAERDPSALDELAGDLFALGTTTADLHAALASDPHAEAFVPELVTTADVQSWSASVHAQADTTIALIERHRTEWAAEAGELGRSLAGLRRAIERRLRLLDGPIEEPFRKIRIHGDYHLGQTLKTPDGFAIIDFEGEPTKPIAERRRKHCVLKDVAGMIRSLDYARETARGTATHAAASGLAATSLRDAFVEGYHARAAVHGAALLPSSVEAVAAWTGLFELEKALYEAEYEVNNRPAWVHLPLRALARLTS